MSGLEELRVGGVEEARGKTKLRKANDKELEGIGHTPSQILRCISIFVKVLEIGGKVPNSLLQQQKRVLIPTGM
jgi:hypothetical protein